MYLLLTSGSENYNPERNFEKFSEHQDLWRSKSFIRFVLNYIKDNYDEEMFLEFMNLCACAENSEKFLINLGVIGPLLSKIMDDEWNERAQVLGFKAIGCLSTDRDARGTSDVLNNGLFRVQDDLESVIFCLKAATNFVYKCTTNKEMAVSSKLGKTLLLILEDHSDVDEVHEWVANFLRSFGRTETLTTPYRSKFLEVLLKRNFDSVFPTRSEASSSASNSPIVSPSTSSRIVHSSGLSSLQSLPTNSPAVEVLSTTIPVSRFASIPLPIPHLSIPTPSPSLHVPSLPSPRSSSHLIRSTSAPTLDNTGISPPGSPLVPLSSFSLVSSPPPPLLVSTLWAAIQLVANQKDAKLKFLELDGLLFAFSSMAYYGCHPVVALPALTLLSLLAKVNVIRAKMTDFFWHPEVFSFVFSTASSAFVNNEGVLRSWTKFLFRMCGDSTFRSNFGNFIVQPLLALWSSTTLSFPIHKIFLLLALQLTKTQHSLEALRTSLSQLLESKLQQSPKKPTRTRITTNPVLTQWTLQTALEQLLSRYRITTRNIDEPDPNPGANQLVSRLEAQLKLIVINDTKSSSTRTREANKPEPLVIKMYDDADEVDMNYLNTDIDAKKKDVLSPRTRQDLLRAIRSKKTQKMKEEMEKLAEKKPVRNLDREKVQRRRSFHAGNFALPLERMPKLLTSNPPCPASPDFGEEKIETGSPRNHAVHKAHLLHKDRRRSLRGLPSRTSQTITKG